ncbi:hypothetical protein [Haloarcula amylolytica]|uniref:hypothetical protein n=1 Tax=Haloarcula amylolytica TaxID=396317 RepID=UPI003C76EC43
MTDYDLTDFFSPEELDKRNFQDVLDADERTREELVEDSFDSKGLEVFNDIRALYSTLNMVNTNFALLTKKRDEFMSHDALYWMKKSGDEMQKFFREYMRLLHNYAASVHTLISHSYTFLDRYEDEKPNLKPEYFEEIGSRDLETKVNLIKQIRHYTQKNWTPPLSANISPTMNEDEKDELYLFLKRDEMLEWNGWDSDVREFLKSLDEDILITELAEEYQEEMNDFYDWFRMFTLSEFYDEIMEYVTAQIILEDRHSHD